MIHVHTNEEYPDNKNNFYIGRERIMFTSYQKQTLQNWFQAKPYPNEKEKRQLARSLNISDQTITTWLYNQRRRNRKGVRCTCKCMSDF